MTGHVRALVARMLWAGMRPETITHTTGVPLADVLKLDAELRRTLRP